MKNKLLILRGVPASGKSTWAKEFVSGKKDWVIVSRDEIREATGTYWVPSREDYISEVEEFQIRSAIKNNLNVIIDATNLNPKTQEKWKNLAKELDVEIDFKDFFIDFKTALERDNNRIRKVGKKVLEGFFSKYFPKELKDYYTDKRKFVPYDAKKRDCIICDIDGTAALHQGRSPYDLKRVLEDKPNWPLLYILKELNKSFYIIFLSGREGTKQCYDDTMEWLCENFDSENWELQMRKKNDYRPDEVIKEEIYHNNIEPIYNVIAVFDDRQKVCDMWRNLGLLCNQVYYGDF